MASPSGPCSGSSLLMRNLSSEEDLQDVMDRRKRKRVISNREAARRSRLRKQKQLDDLSEQLAQLKKQNDEITTSLNVSNQLYMNMESENSVLKAQLAELTHRLESLNDIISYANLSNGVFRTEDNYNTTGYIHQNFSEYDYPLDKWNSNPPIMDMVMY
uniref:BZIP domain-containing protein n=1 Tax=Rhizophora mucronata TaxID=61149 RepID=A0A2P2JSP6_RHIMU